MTVGRADATIAVNAFAAAVAHLSAHAGLRTGGDIVIGEKKK